MSGVARVPNVRVIINHSKENFVQEVFSIKRSEDLAEAVCSYGLRSAGIDNCELLEAQGSYGKVEITMSRDLARKEATLVYETIGDIAFTDVGRGPALLRQR